MKTCYAAIVLLAAATFQPPTVTGSSAPTQSESAPEGWRQAAPRDEIRPAVSFAANAGRDGKGEVIIQHDAREGLDGYWTKTFPVKGGQFYRFQSFRKTTDVSSPRRSALVRILWQDDKGKKVLRDEATAPATAENHVGYSKYAADVLPGYTPTAEAEYPLDKTSDAKGWTEVSDVYRAPARATRAIVELHLQWAPRGKIEWSDIS